ncbi:MAG: 50S ribosomal protein L6 [Candidatus Magasanikbacteria bacterium]|nr:50S ribosomal protein L6 [Candidatus Magasanikbacteria bacterium]
MSRIGKQIIQIPQGVTVETADGFVIVKGPKGELKRALNSIVKVNITENQATVSVENETNKKERSLWGTFSSHIKNMVVGVSVGYKKQLEINGVGYRVVMQGKDLKIEVGFSHPVLYSIPEGITATTEKNLITIEGIDKELVGQTSAEIRAIKKPEPYKGKGIKYVDEVIRRKAGKAAKAA